MPCACGYCFLRVFVYSELDYYELGIVLFLVIRKMKVDRM